MLPQRRRLSKPMVAVDCRHLPPHMASMNKVPAACVRDGNPFFEDWTGPYGVPPFARIEPEHFLPAFEQAFAGHAAEVAAIAGDTAAPTFANTIDALECAGLALTRVSNVFHTLASAHTNDAILALEREVAPLEAKHWNRILLDEGLFRRVDALHRRRGELGLRAEQERVLDRYHTMFKRAGAALDEPAKTHLAAINERLASLGTAFGQNVLADEQRTTFELEGDEHLAGLPDFVRAAARAAGEERGRSGKHVITISRSSVEPFLQFSARRDLREKIFRAWTVRGDGGGATDNKAIIAEMMALRAERARLLGYPTFAHYRLDDTMAKTPQAVRALLDRVRAPARQHAMADRDALQELVRAEGKNFALAPWDWRYYAEKLRKARCDVDEETIKPYFQLDRMIEAAFHTANRLFGLSFEPCRGVPVWHEDVRAWEVKDAQGRPCGLYFADYFARPSKHSGAWMTSLRDQERLTDDIRPIVVNVMNFSKSSEGEPVLLSFDDARTLFHEFGHALHGLLSNVTYPMVSGTSVLQDWVELPSQLYEHWLERPEILSRFAIHSRTGEPMPQDLLRRLIAARTFNQGCATLEYIASALLDLELHLRPSGSQAEGFEIGAFEQEILARIEMPAEIGMRHRPTHFQHLFGGGYAAAYYSYMWSEVLDADAFAAFEATGDIFDAETARKLRDHVYAAGGSRDPVDLYLAFRGRLPEPDGLLKQRGLLGAPQE
jgi:peptidyl-dipeptidase Dcp